MTASPRFGKLGSVLGPLLVGAAVIASPVEAAEERVTLDQFSYAPASLMIKQGDSVTWSYDGMDGASSLYGVPLGGGAPHNVRFVGGSSKLSGNADGSPSGAAWTKGRTFDTAGTFRYFCDVHGKEDGSGMAGVVTVDGAAAGAPTAATAAPKLSGRALGGSSLRLKLESSGPAMFTAVLQRFTSRTGSPRRFGTLRRALRAGTNTLRVPRTREGKRLTPGRYRLIGRAVAADGRKSSVLRRTFTIRR